MCKKVEIYKKQKRYNDKYLELAKCWSKLSHAKRKKVGCIIVKNGSIISDGYNGTPKGFDNKCEDSDGKTKWYVMHAEANAILKLSKSNNSSIGSTLYTTLSPCRECAKLILQAEVEKVYYNERYKDTTGIDFLENNGIVCINL
jgi:dCMP deaminase